MNPVLSRVPGVLPFTVQRVQRKISRPAGRTYSRSRGSVSSVAFLLSFISVCFSSFGRRLASTALLLPFLPAGRRLDSFHKSRRHHIYTSTSSTAPRFKRQQDCSYARYIRSTSAISPRSPPSTPLLRFSSPCESLRLSRGQPKLLHTIMTNAFFGFPPATPHASGSGFNAKRKSRAWSYDEEEGREVSRHLLFLHTIVLA